MIKSKLAFAVMEDTQSEQPHRMEFTPLPAVTALLEALDENGIRYCHWKSNSRLDWGLAGRTDLDLLVDPGQEQLFTGLLNSLGIKKLVAPKSKQYPGLEHYLGFDDRTGRLFHLHVHYKLVLGEQHVKNYHLPIEKEVLEHTGIKFGVKVPVSEIELILLSIRALLKYRDRDVIKDMFNIRYPGIPEHILTELLTLLEQTSIEEVKETLKKLNILQDPAIIPDLLDIIRQAPRSGSKLFRLRRKLRKNLKPYQRQCRIFSTMQYFQTLLKNTGLFGSADDQRLRFPESGRLIALVGIDGSGKSTLSEKLSDWLKWKVSAPLHYLGSKQPSFGSNYSYLVFRMFRRTHTELSKIFGGENLLLKALASFRSLFLALHYLFVGRDRIGRYKLAREQAAAGSIVIFDRFPFFSPLDGPEIGNVLGGNIGSALKRIETRERELYQGFDKLDLLIVMEVDPEVSLQRKPDHSRETIESKFEALTRLKGELDASRRFSWVQVNANMPFEEVFLEVKRKVWAQL